MFTLDLRDHYSLVDYFSIRDKMQFMGVLWAVLHGILVAILSTFRSADNKKTHWFLGTILLHIALTYSLFTNLSKDIYMYINMQSKTDYIILDSSETLVQMKPDEVGHNRYYIFHIGFNSKDFTGYFSNLNYEISKERYSKIDNNEEVVNVKLYKGKYGYYHSPEIVE